MINWITIHAAVDLALQKTPRLLGWILRTPKHMHTTLITPYVRSSLPFRRRACTSLLPVLSQGLGNFVVRPIPQVPRKIHILRDFTRFVLRCDGNEVLPSQITLRHLLARSEEDGGSGGIRSALSHHPKRTLHRIAHGSKEFLPCIHRFGWDVAGEEAVGVDVVGTLLLQDLGQLTCEKDNGELATGVAPTTVDARWPFDTSWGGEETEIKLLAAHVKRGGCVYNARIAILRRRGFDEWEEKICENIMTDVVGCEDGFYSLGRQRIVWDRWKTCDIISAKLRDIDDD